MTEPNNHVEKPENPRKAIREARERRLRVIDGPPKTLKVYAASEALRASLRHGNGTRFRSSLSEAAEWPNDSFTARRIAEGSVLVDGPASGGERAAPDETKNPREQAAANKPKPAGPKSEPRPQQKSGPKQPPEPPAA